MPRFEFPATLTPQGGPHARKRHDKAKAERIAWLATNYDSATKEELAEVQAELDRLQERELQPLRDIHGREVSLFAGYPGSAPSGASKGWKSGHWSEAFMKEMKDLTPSGSVTVPSLSAGIVRIEDRPQRLLDVLPVERLDATDQYQYLQETVRTNNAAEVASSALKPTSVYSVVKQTGSVRTIAHLSQPIDRFDLEDAALLRQYVDDSLRQGVQLRLDSQLINGNGVAPNLQGISSASGISTILFSTSLLQTTRKAVTELESDEIYGGVFVLNPAQWESLELTTTPSPGGYVLGGPVDRAAQRLWGRPVIVTSACPTANGFLVDFAGSTRLYERGGVRVDWSEAPVGSVAGESAFKSNELVFRGEGRWGFALLRGAGVVKFPTA